MLNFAAMMTCIDDSIANITAAYERKGILNNTIIIFSSGTIVSTYLFAETKHLPRYSDLYKTTAMTFFKILTTVFFPYPDNGGALYGGSSNFPLRGEKMTLFEGMLH